MALIGPVMRSVFQRTKINNSTIIANRFYKHYTKLSLNREWREKNGLPENPNSFGPLTNFPDYSFKDGRPTPLGGNQKQRIMRQRGYAKRIMKLVGEIDFAVDRHAKLLKEKEENRQKILDSKFEPKGNVLLDESKQN